MMGRKRTFLLLNIGYISNETNADVHLYIEEFILVEIWIHYCTNWNWFTLENTLTKDDILTGPKIKIGTGKPKKPKHSKKSGDTESDTPWYSMRV